MRKYWSFFRIQLISGLQYRVAAWAGLCTQFFWGIMEILIYRAFYLTGSGQFPMEFSQVTDYMWLQQAFLTLFFAWTVNGDVTKAIQNGDIAYELARPVNLYTLWSVKEIADRAAKAMLRFWPVILVAILLPEPYNLAAPTSLTALICFVITMAASSFLVTAYLMLVHTATIYTLNPMGVRLVAVSMVEFLTGALIPLPFLPSWLQRILEISPFGSMQNLPLRIYCGNIAGAQLWQSMALQLFWIAALILLGRAWMSRAMRRIAVQGG